ncbi:DUF4164 domain-containing protein [Amorphus orientalis]|uniref:Chromosome segregation ATPase n=1 Tax=Amorphus orientalis TaxID=649198 RepID=A0AAE3VRG5_9HYPH|nr:DUF4164 domain-containing protein [Amorphus orientalis]MDQ0316984.1 chromosome segregation ATPase [Amorphus orientalis]
MADRPTVDQAFDALETALERLEAAVNRRVEADRRRANLEDEVQRLTEDRSELAGSLDRSEARAGRLEDANREVSRRLVTAMETIRTVLDKHGG